jgi:hypothetical protein
VPAKGLVIVKTFPNEMAALTARAILEANGIASVVSSDGASGLEPQLLFVNGVRLSVLPENADAARELLEPVGDDGAPEDTDER